jgi:TetR/AcrR family transcriptional regulator
MTRAKKKRKAGRPKASDGPVVTRLQLLETAALAFGKDGFDGASLRGIAATAGVSLSTLQNHFRTKRDLWRGVIEELVVPSMEAELTDPDELEEHESVIAGIVEGRIETAISRPGLSTHLLHDASDAGQERLEILAEASESMRDDFREMLVAMRDEELIRDLDIDAIIVVLGMMIPALSSAKHSLRELVDFDLDDDDDRERLSEALTDIVLHGLLPRD